MTLYMIIFFSFLICVAIIDYRSMTIPNELILILGGFAFITPFLQQNISLMNRIIGFFVISLPMLLLCMVIHGAFGGGDIKLMAICGFILGYQNIVLAMILGCILASIYGVYLMFFKQVERRAHMCLGPFLSIGIMISMLFGNKIIIWYMCEMPK